MGSIKRRSELATEASWRLNAVELMGECGDLRFEGCVFRLCNTAASSDIFRNVA